MNAQEIQAAAAELSKRMIEQQGFRVFEFEGLTQTKQSTYYRDNPDSLDKVEQRVRESFINGRFRVQYRSGQRYTQQYWTLPGSTTIEVLEG